MKASTKNVESAEHKSCAMELGHEKNYAFPHTIVHTVPEPIYECGCLIYYLVSCDQMGRHTDMQSVNSCLSTFLVSISSAVSKKRPPLSSQMKLHPRHQN